MEKSTKSAQLSGHQFVLLIFVSVIAIKMMMLPALIFKDFGRDSFVVYIIYIVLEAIALFCLIIAQKTSNGRSIFQITEYFLEPLGTIGIIIAKVIFALLSIFYFIKLLLLLGETNVFFSGIYETFGWKVMIIPVLAVIAIIACSTRGMGRVGEFFAPILLVGVIVLCILILINTDLSDLLPLGYDMSISIRKGYNFFKIIRLAIWFGDVSVLFIFCGNISIKDALINNKNEMKKISEDEEEKDNLIEKEKNNDRYFFPSYIWFAIGAIAILIIIMVFSATYANLQHLMFYGVNLSGITQSKVGSIGRVDLLIFAVLTLSIFLLMGIYLSALVRCLTYVTNLDKYVHVTIPVLVLLYFISVFIFNEKNNLLIFAYSSFVVALIFQFIAPVVFMIFSILTKDLE